MKISIIPTGGLCNRMRAMATGVAIARHYNSHATVYWNNCTGLKADFKELFKPINENDVLVVENNDWIYNIKDTKGYLLRRPIFQMRYNQVYFNYSIYSSHETDIFTKIDGKKNKDILLVSCCPMCDQMDLHALFVPIDEIQFDIDKIASQYTEHTIGIHIRRTDSKESIKNSPIDAFEKRIQAELCKNANTIFYVASDDNEVKRYFKNKYPKNVITIFDDTSRNSIDGMRFAVVDLFCLSRTNHIIGSFYSSYSHIASVLGGITIEYATNNRNI